MIQKYLLEQTVTNIISFLEYDSVREILTEREREIEVWGGVCNTSNSNYGLGRQATSTQTTSPFPLEYSLNEMGEDHYFHHPSSMSIE
jgi:hypothetical protein